MPKINIDVPSKHPASETFQRIKGFLDHDQDLRRLDSQYQCEFNETEMTGLARGSQFKADLKVESSGSGSQVKISVELPFALGLFKGKIQHMLENKLEKTLG